MYYEDRTVKRRENGTYRHGSQKSTCEVSTKFGTGLIIILYFLIFTYLSTMSDREGHSGPPGDDDLSLPKATVAKMISGICLELNSCATHLHGLSRATTKRYRLCQGDTRSRHRVLCR